MCLYFLYIVTLISSPIRWPSLHVVPFLMLHISHVTALFKNEKETAEKYIRKLQDELLITTDTGKQYFSSFLCGYLSQNELHSTLVWTFFLFQGFSTRATNTQQINYQNCSRLHLVTVLDRSSAFIYFCVFCKLAYLRSFFSRF